MTEGNFWEGNGWHVLCFDRLCEIKLFDDVTQAVYLLLFIQENQRNRRECITGVVGYLEELEGNLTFSPNTKFLPIITGNEGLRSNGGVGFNSVKAGNGGNEPKTGNGSDGCNSGDVSKVANESNGSTGHDKSNSANSTNGSNGTNDNRPFLKMKNAFELFLAGLEYRTMLDQKDLQTLSLAKGHLPAFYRQAIQGDVAKVLLF